MVVVVVAVVVVVVVSSPIDPFATWTPASGASPLLERFAFSCRGWDALPYLCLSPSFGVAYTMAQCCDWLDASNRRRPPGKEVCRGMFS